MNINCLIDAKNYGGKRFYLWQINHYHYRIECFSGEVYVDLRNTKCEQAKEAFKTFRPVRASDSLLTVRA